MEGYFVVVTKNGKHYDFDGRCNKIDYHNEHLCVFKHIKEGKPVFETLALIPYSNIESIINTHEKGEYL